jgi:hypothetical protein
MTSRSPEAAFLIHEHFEKRDYANGAPPVKKRAWFVDPSGPVTPSPSACYQRRLIPVVGHDTPQEAPAAVTAAVLDLIR